MRQIAIVFNQNSGPTNQKDEIKKFCDSLPQEDFFIKIREISAGESLEEVTKGLITGNYDTIVAAGGDGTVNAVAQNIIKTKLKMGILPLGTLNHLAKDLNIPLDMTEALSLITGPHETIEIDVASCNGIIFLNNSGLGIYPKIVEVREKFQRKGLLKWFAFIFAFILVIKNIPKPFIKLKIEKEVISKKTSFIFVGNNIYGLGGLKTGTRESLSDGLLSIWISHRTSFFGIIVLFFHAIFGKVKEHRDFDVFESEEIIVETKKKNISVSFDGEVNKVESPLLYKIEPRCLKVIVASSEAK